MRSKTPAAVTPALLRRWPLPPPDAGRGKDARGRVLVVGGSDHIPGGAILAALAALRAGAGTLQIATSARVSGAVAASVPEACVFDLPVDRRGELSARGITRLNGALDEADALLLGPGMANPAATNAILHRLFRRKEAPTIVVDAAALRFFSSRRTLARRHKVNLVVTPHAGEMANLAGLTKEQVEADPLRVAKETAARLGAVVILKGAETIIAAPDGVAFKNSAGNPGLGTSGSGDTLSGVVAGLAARGTPAFQASVWGVYLHAKAGDRLARTVGPLGYLARELLAEIPSLMANWAK